MTPEQLRQCWLQFRAELQEKLLASLTDANANEVTAKRDALKEFHRVISEHLDTFKPQG